MEKYNKGPWCIDCDNETTWIESQYQTICTDVSNCDASLISAAPEMYEALKGFLALCPSSDGLGGHAPIEAFFVIADKARKAILKAEGRSEE